jgi:TonB family protein
MKYLFLCLFFNLLYSTNAQSTTRYFKDIKKGYEVFEKVEKKAKYKETVTTLENRDIRTVFINFKTKDTIKVEHHKEGRPIGIWKIFDYKGKVSAIGNFDQLHSYYAHDTSLHLHDFPYDSTLTDEIEAPFLVDSNGIYDYFIKNFHYPENARDAGIQGKVYICIKIEKSGKVKVVSIVQSAHPFLDVEAVIFFQKMPIWTPAKKNGEPIDYYMLAPVNYVINTWN